MRHAAFLVPLLLLVAAPARADEPVDPGANPYSTGSWVEVTPGGAAPAADAAAPASDSAAPASDSAATPASDEGDAEASEPRGRRATRVKDHAIGVGYYYTHMQWNDYEAGSTPQIDYHALAIRYSWFIGQAQRFGFILNAAATVPMRASQSGNTANPSLDGRYSLLDTYERHVGFDLNLLVGTHRMLSDDLAAIAGLGMHVGIIKLNDQALSIHEYAAVGVAAVFSLRYYAGDLMTVGVDVNASSDYRDMMDHRSPLDWTINLGLAATVGMRF